MDKIYIDGLGGRVRTALKENGELTEIVYESGEGFDVGGIYAGRVAKVLKGQFIFINIGAEKNAFLQPDTAKEPFLYNSEGKLIVKEGDCLTVQLTKAAVDEKGAVVSTRLNFSGKYCVVIARDFGIGVSRKIDDEVKRTEFKALAEKLLPKGFGVIMRTECENTPIENVENELKMLVERANKVLAKGESIKPPALVYEELSETSRIVRDLAVNKDTEVITNSSEIAEKLKSETGIESVSLYTEKVPFFNNFGIESAIEKALHKKVWLKSGGYLVFDYSEAMNVIDVNSGKHSGKNLKNFALKVNLEAAEEIAKQIKLRNLTGMIIIDFIDMKNNEDINKVSARLKECVAKDRITTALVGMTELGLMQLTRKKNRLPLHKTLMRSCPCCMGTGLTENEFYVADKVLSEIISLLTQTIYNKISIKCSGALKKAFNKYERTVAALQKEFDAEITFEEVPTARLYYYSIEKYTKTAKKN